LKILLTGASGQVGGALRPLLATLGELHVPSEQELDLSSPDSIAGMVRALKPELIVNPAAYTEVDEAESRRDHAFAVNARGPEVFATEAKRIGALLVHFSTDYVFDGGKKGPYVEGDPTGPLGVYGASKLEGERAVAATDGRYLIFRTSWVYARQGRSFLTAMLGRAESPELRIVDDQHGAPTSADALAAAVFQVLKSGRRAQGLYHASCSGETTWYGFAHEIFATLARRGSCVPKLVPIRSEDYRSAAKRPRNSVLDNGKLLRDFGVALPHWKAALDKCLAVNAPPP
jgi:dTDP-4-dehydrorhamnose reductase